MTHQLTIQLDSTETPPTFRPGDTVHGVVRLAAASDLRPRSITLRAFGDEITSLGPNVAMSEHTHPFDLSFNLWSPSPAHAVLPAGEHTYPFEFVLPAVLPPTFSGELTNIAYRIEAKVDLPLHSDLRAEQSFTVRVPPLVDPDKPVRATTSSPQGLTLELELKSSGFYPGDHLLGRLQLIGSTDKPIKQVALELISRERGEAHDFVDRVEGVRVRLEIDPKQLLAGQPFPIDLPIPNDVDPSFNGQHSSKARLVRAQVDLEDGQQLALENVIRVGVR